MNINEEDFNYITDYYNFGVGQKIILSMTLGMAQRYDLLYYMIGTLKPRKSLAPILNYEFCFYRF